MPEQQRLIKKYPNRRLYDTRTSSYITLADVKDLVLNHEHFQVLDAKSGEDLTRSILLQIILEEEAGGAPMFTSDLLAHMIRFYGNAMQGMMGKYLESNIKAFTEMQVKLQDQARAMMLTKRHANSRNAALLPSPESCPAMRVATSEIRPNPCSQGEGAWFPSFAINR